ncbi:hypothetical protein ACQEU8_20505 [Streptomyces sp. CA-250714]
MGERSAVADEFFGPDVAESFRTSGGTGPPAARQWHDFTAEPG